MTRPDGIDTPGKVDVCPNVPPATCQTGQTIRVASISVTCARVKPVRIVVYQRAIVMNGINQLVVNGRAEGSSIAPGIQHRLAPAIMYSFPVGVRILGPLVAQPPPATEAEAGDSEAFVRPTGNAKGELAAMNANVSKVVLTVCISVPPDCCRKTVTD